MWGHRKKSSRKKGTGLSFQFWFAHPVERPEPLDATGKDQIAHINNRFSKDILTKTINKILI